MTVTSVQEPEFRPVLRDTGDDEINRWASDPTELPAGQLNTTHHLTAGTTGIDRHRRVCGGETWGNNSFS